MFRCQGKSRTVEHNLQVAVVLLFVAGMVSVTGFLFMGKLTVNVTGHFAYLVYDVPVAELWKGPIYFLYIFTFLTGSFCSGLLIEYVNYHRKYSKYLALTLLECFLLLSVWGLNIFPTGGISQNITACILLSAMGLQNAFATKISNPVVRTTYLTGLLTDPGIEPSRLLYLHKSHYETYLIELRNRIRLWLFTITFFFSGGFCAGYLYIARQWQLYTLLLSVAILLLGLSYDGMHFFYSRNKRYYETYYKRRKRRCAIRRQSRNRHKQARG